MHFCRSMNDAPVELFIEDLGTITGGYGSTAAVGEEGGGSSTLSGGEGGYGSTAAVGEEGGGSSTLSGGEGGGGSTAAVGEEGGGGSQPLGW